MSEASEQFIQIGAPFRAAARTGYNPKVITWAVRDRHGYTICECDDEDAAAAISDALNEAKQKQ